MSKLSNLTIAQTSQLLSALQSQGMAAEDAALLMDDREIMRRWVLILKELVKDSKWLPAQVVDISVGKWVDVGGMIEIKAADSDDPDHTAIAARRLFGFSNTEVHVLNSQWENIAYGVQALVDKNGDLVVRVLRSG